ncbi:MAG: mycothiol synthase [Micrococcales bacterium]|nr:mycothiol synthase [Micrococcales bacterium]
MTSQRVDAHAVLDLAARAEQVDQVAPLDEATLLALRHTDRQDPVVHLTVHNGDRLVGYAQVRADGPGSVVELVVDPDHRRQAMGTALLHQAQTQAGAHTVEVWAHGDLPAAQALVAKVGGQAVRRLWLLGRDVTALDEQAPQTDQPGQAGSGGRSQARQEASTGTPQGLPAAPGVHLRQFRVGEDEQAWLQVNARAFAGHPEQGRTSLDDLLVREHEPWFDPQGLILAVDDDDTVVGSIWTKQHTPHVGEIYVLGVDPDAQGKGVGRALTAAGIAHLATRGATRVVLFVEADNHVALTTYRAAGFAPERAHTRYRLPQRDQPHHP